MHRKFFVPLFFLIMAFLFYKFGVLTNKEKAVGAFTFGNIQAERIENCEPLSGFQVFCREGYILRELDKGLNIFEAHLKSFPVETLLATGMHLAKTKIKLNDLPLNQYMQLKNYLFVVDGWSFGRIVIYKLNPVNLINHCEQSSDIKIKNACLFGIGRAIFFSNKSFIDIESKNEVKLGYYFAKRFAGKDESNDSVASTKLAMEYEKSLFTPNGKSSNNCVIDHGYFLDCL